MRRGKPATYRKAILEGLYQAMRETFDVPEGDRFMILTEHDQDDFVYDADYLGIQRSDDLVYHPAHRQQHPPDGAKAKALPAHRRETDRKPRPAPRRHLHQSRRGASGKLVVRPWRGAIRQDDRHADARAARDAASTPRPPRSCAAAPASCAPPGATSSNCPPATSTLRRRIM